MTSQHVGPISLPEFTEIKLLHFTKTLIALVPDDLRFLEILLREVHALELIQ